MNDKSARPLQFHLGDLIVVITIAAFTVALWRYELQTNPDSTCQGGVLLHATRLAWNFAFATKLCLIAWVRWRMPVGDAARLQWLQLTSLSFPQLAFFALVLVGIGLGPGAFGPLRAAFSALWLSAAVMLILLLYGLTVEAVSPPHRVLHLAALTSAALTVCAPCCF